MSSPWEHYELLDDSLLVPYHPALLLTAQSVTDIRRSTTCRRTGRAHSTWFVMGSSLVASALPFATLLVLDVPGAVWGKCAHGQVHVLVVI